VITDSAVALIAIAGKSPVMRVVLGYDAETRTRLGAVAFPSG
jgi:hypothetical protein